MHSRVTSCFPNRNLSKVSESIVELAQRHESDLSRLDRPNRVAQDVELEETRPHERHVATIKGTIEAMTAVRRDQDELAFGHWRSCQWAR